MDRQGFAAGQGLRQLLEAIVAIGAESDLPTLLQRVVSTAADLADARYAALGVLDASGNRLSEFLHVGFDDETVARIGKLPEGHGLLGLLIVDPKPIRLANIDEHVARYGFPPNHPPMTSFLGVPIRVREAVFGNLYLTDKRDGGEFTDLDEELVVALAAALGVAIDNSRLHEQIGEIARISDRDRIARDLHDTVIQRLFAVGLSLQRATREPDAADVSQRVHNAIDEIDATIRDIRSVIFDLRDLTGSHRGVRSTVIELCNEATRTLGFEPTVRFDGPLDTVVTDQLSEHLLGTIREALANVTKHANATAVNISVAAAGGALRLEVRDNGRGMEQARRERSGGRATGEGHGLDNMRARAQQLGGWVEINSSSETGTALEWQVPLSPPT